MSYYVHQVPGRLRIKSPSIKGNQKEAVVVEDLLQQMDGIKSTAVNTLTGSVVVNYDSRMVTDHTIIARLTDLGHFNPAQAKTNDEYIQGAFSTAGEIVWKAFFGSFVDVALAGHADFFCFRADLAAPLSNRLPPLPSKSPGHRGFFDCPEALKT